MIASLHVHRWSRSGSSRSPRCLAPAPVRAQDPATPADKEKRRSGWSGSSKNRSAGIRSPRGAQSGVMKPRPCCCVAQSHPRDRRGSQRP